MTSYPERLKRSCGRSVPRPQHPASFHKGLWGGIAYSALDTFVLRGKAPWTFKNHADHLCLKKASEAPKIQYPKPDGVLTFDKLSSVFISNTNHEENQPPHLTLKDPSIPIWVNLPEYDAPEQRYCPAGVYEIVRDDADQPQARSTRRTASTARPATSRTRPRTSTGWCPRRRRPNYPNM